MNNQPNNYNSNYLEHNTKGPYFVPFPGSNPMPVSPANAFPSSQPPSYSGMYPGLSQVSSGSKSSPVPIVSSEYPGQEGIRINNSYPHFNQNNGIYSYQPELLPVVPFSELNSKKCSVFTTCCHCGQTGFSEFEYKTNWFILILSAFMLFFMNNLILLATILAFFAFTRQHACSNCNKTITSAFSCFY